MNNNASGNQKWKNDNVLANLEIPESNMYAVIPNGGCFNNPPMKSICQTNCGTKTPTAAIDAHSGSPVQIDATPRNNATSQKNTKFVGPNSRQ